MIDSKMYLLTFTTMLCTFCVQTSLSTVDENTSENRCPEGYGYIGGECMKKFVKPEFVQCPTPDLKFGNYELQLEGRVIDYWCEDGWTLVPDEFASAACILGKNFNQKIQMAVDFFKNSTAVYSSDFDT